MTSGAAGDAADAADALLAWLANRAKPRPASSAHCAADTALSAAEADLVSADLGLQADFGATPDQRESSYPAAPKPDVVDSHITMRLPTPDWLHHRLTISGAVSEVERFRRAAAGAGIIPWMLDLDRLEENYFHMLVAPERRSLSIAGARIFARQLRDAVGRRHDLAASRVGQSQACPFDLHAVLPVPHDILVLGPDDPKALAWLWAHWGTTEALRHVAEDGREDGIRKEAGASEGVFRVEFWSADWTPWRALRAVGQAWPTLRFETRPSYDWS